jgi:hypothetical protein
MNIMQAEGWARRLRNASWYADLRSLGQSLRAPRRESSRLFIAGHPDDQPWHLTAHLEMLADFRGIPEIRPTLVRGLEIPAQANDRILVVSEYQVPDRVLEELDGARTRGAAVLGLTTDDPELTALADEAVALDLDRLNVGVRGLVADFELASHMLGVAASTPNRRRIGNAFRRRPPGA